MGGGGQFICCYIFSNKAKKVQYRVSLNRIIWLYIKVLC